MSSCFTECQDVDSCCLGTSFLELVDTMVRDIQHCEAEAVRWRYRYFAMADPDHQQITPVDVLSDLVSPYYDNMAYQMYMGLYYDGGDPMAFKAFVDFMERLANGSDDNRY